jgi:hypothetical protein
MLTNEEKTGIINQHKRNIVFNRYNIELSLMEENALTTPNAETVASLTAQVAELDRKLTALDEELEALA